MKAEISPIGRDNSVPVAKPQPQAMPPPTVEKGGKAQSAQHRRNPPAACPEVKISLEESMVLRAVPEGGTSIDAVVRDSGLSAGKVNSLLVQLRLKRRIRFLPGNRVVPV